MSDEMDEFSRLLKNNRPPAPNDFVKNQSIDRAMAAFDKKNAAHAQGTGWWLRLMGAVRAAQPNDGGVMKRSYIVAGSVCMASLAVALLSSTSLQNEFLQVEKDQAIVAVKPVETPAAPGGVVPQIVTEKETAMEGAPAAPPAEFNRSALAKAELKESRSDFDAAGAGNASADMAVASVQSQAPSPAPIMMKQLATDSRAKKSEMGYGLSGMVAPSDMMVQPGYHDEGRDKFEHAKSNPLKLVKDEPVSTFSIDVDSASYAFVRSSLNNNVLPQKDAVRVEEMINYFPYDYTMPKSKSVPFASSVNVMPSPWNKGTKLIHIGIKGYELRNEKPHANLVFLIDTSGSMNEPNKLPLLKNSLKLLLDSLAADDTVAIVTYAGNAGVALEPTKVSDKGKILSVIDSFNSGGSTAGAEGIRQAYQLAERNFDAKGINRVILATDGDFNVGITDPNELKSFIERKRDTGVTLSVLGFGRGNYNDALMQTLAQNGNGNASYIDNLNEARKVLVEEASSTLFTIAKDVKIQVEFNPAKVAEYRLIGYETRMLNREDFNNDKIDAGDIGAGHTVTAIYEITPAGSDAKLVDNLRYGKEKPAAEVKDQGGEYAFLKIRYKLPKEDVSKLITTPIDRSVEVGSVNNASTEARFATAVAAFGQLLRGGEQTASFNYDDVIALAQSSKGADNFGYRAEFVNLVRLAKAASGMQSGQGGNPPVVNDPVIYE